MHQHEQKAEEQEEEEQEQENKQNVKRFPSKLEREHVHEVYEAISSHFSMTRFNMWPKVREFLTGLPAGSLIADVGCGNGKYLGANKKCFALGSDRSESLINICKNKKHEVMVCDNMLLPYRECSFDAAISIAVIHHFSTPERRQCALEEIHRIVRVGGVYLVYVWSFEEGGQKKGKTVVTQSQQDALIDWKMPKKRQQKRKNKQKQAKPPRGVATADRPVVVESLKDKHKHAAATTESKHGEEEEEDSSSTQPQKRHEEYKRYYHMFKKGELEALVANIKGATIQRSGFDHQNWFVVVEKTAPL